MTVKLFGDFLKMRRATTQRRRLSQVNISQAIFQGENIPESPTEAFRAATTVTLFSAPILASSSS